MPEFIDQVVAVGRANPLFALGAAIGLVLILSSFVRSR
jgi:hypothetical protein